MLRLDPPEREQFLSKHNLLACVSELRRIREAIRKGHLWDLLEYRTYANPAFRKFLARIVQHSLFRRREPFQEKGMLKFLARIVQHSLFLERFTPTVKPRGISHFGEASDFRPEMVRYNVRRVRVPVERGRSVVLLPGRWRRPYHEDPRNLPIVSKLTNRPNVSICFYTVPFGPVPIELDETFPLAQTESFDSHEP